MYVSAYYTRVNIEYYVERGTADLKGRNKKYFFRTALIRE